MSVLASGCGGFAARRIAQAPNRYPSWLAPHARVLLAFDQNISSNLPSQYVKVGPPEAQLRYRVMPAADFKLELSSTNWSEQGERKFQFNFRSEWPGQTNEFTTTPRGTVVLLHGYGLADYAMFPWALRLAQDGWRCVLVDLRGHGKSTGKQISFGVHEQRDLSQLLDKLENELGLTSPIALVGVSYGASLALRWKASDARVGPTVAIAPYGVLSNAVMNICREYAPCLPLAFPRAGMKNLPELLNVEPAELDPVAVMRRHPVKSLLIVGTHDMVTPPQNVQTLRKMLEPDSKMVLVLRATHETVAYQFKEVAPLVEDWISGELVK